MGFERHAVELKSIQAVVAFKLCEELQDAVSGYKRRARLPRPVHAVVTVFHRASKDERGVQAANLFKCRALAELVRDGALLHRAPRMVSSVPGRRRTPLD